MVINKWEILCFASWFFSLKFVGTVFISSRISSHIIAELFAKYSPFSQQHVAGFEI